MHQMTHTEFRALIERAIERTRFTARPTPASTAAGLRALPPGRYARGITQDRGALCPVASVTGRPIRDRDGETADAFDDLTRTRVARGPVVFEVTPDA